MTKSELQKQNDRLLERILQLEAENDRLKEPSESLMADVELAIEHCQEQIFGELATLKITLDGLVKGATK